LQGAAQAKEKEFAAIVKIGSTEMQDAVPMTLGAEFSAFAEAFGRDRWRTFKCEERLRVVNIGGTAIGTGIAAPQRYIFLVIEILREITGLGLSRGENLVDATANADPLVETSGILKAHAVNMIKIANDLRLLQMRGEINLPALQTGSSIMPGKVNPVIPESLIQGGITVMANDYRVTEAVSRGSLQLCEFMPLAAHALLESLSILIQGSRMFAPYLERITAVPEQCLARFNRSASIITAFVPVLGYEQATRLFREFSGSGKDNVRDFLMKNSERSRLIERFPRNS
jgi:fumarase (EC 4.2.1.2)